MAVILAVNFEDRLVLLEDGRELPITQFYTSDSPVPLTAKSELRVEHRVDGYEEADVFVVDIPGADAALIVEMSAFSLLKPSQVN